MENDTKAILRAWVAHLTRCDQCGLYARDYIRGCVRGPRCSTGEALHDQWAAEWGRVRRTSRGPKWHRSVGLDLPGQSQTNSGL